MEKNQISGHDIFWAARYAHNTLDPLIKAARQYEPNLHLIITMNFSSERYYRASDNWLDISAHWDRKEPLMFLRESEVHTKEQVDAVAAKVQTFIDTEQATLEAAEDAKAEADYDDLGYEVSDEDVADLLADKDWEFQQERARERADIERDEHGHDIELQNEMSGN